jgi:hypothetical protein
MKGNPTGQYSKAVTGTRVSARNEPKRHILESQAIHVRTPGFGQKTTFRLTSAV